MLKKILCIIFIVACLSVCVTPFACMTFAKSDEQVGNEQETLLPVLFDESGSFNKMYPQQLGDYFSTHYAFRPEIISADATVQSGVFGVSNLESVVVGKDGWLFYSSTLDNYLGKNLLSDRAINNIVNNLEITQRYLESDDKTFVFTVAPNKNTLYPEYMPYYYSQKESEDSDLLNFTKAIENRSVNYCDLLTPLSQTDEVVYLKQDSHWNNKGALIAYDTILDYLGKSHSDYSDSQVTRVKNFYGDLGNMIFPATAQPEYNLEYSGVDSFTYVTDTKSVEEPRIETTNPMASGSLYMYRDSFGNALLPYFANAYNSACFRKTFPVNLALEAQSSDTVIFEIAQRNLVWFAQSPPVIPAREFTVPAASRQTFSLSDEVKAEVSSVNMMYVNITGSVPADLCTADSTYLVVAKDKDNNLRSFEAFTTSTDNSDYGFSVYIPAQYLSDDSTEVYVAINNAGEYTVSESLTLKIQQPTF